MEKILRAAMLLILITTVMFILNSAVLSLLFGIDAGDQLNALTSLAVSGSFPGADVVVSDKAGVRQGMGGLQSRGDLQGSDSQPGTGKPQGEGKSEAAGKNGDDYFITLDEISLLGNMNLQDKLKAVSILSGVDGDILDSAVDMAGDGITYEEYDKLKQSAEAYLDPDDVKTLEEILDRNRSQ